MTSPDFTDLVAELRDLVTKSIEANSRMIQNGTELVRRASSGDKTDLTKLANDGREILNRALRDFVRLSAGHTSRLIHLGVEVSDRIAGRDPGERPSGATPTRPFADLRLSGAPGATCQTAFAVDNDNATPIPVAFEYGMLVDSQGETATDVAIRFEPPEALIPAGGQGRFVVSLTIPDDMPPGRHETLVAIKGMPGPGFRLGVEVGVPWEGPAAERSAEASTTAASPATTKRPARKAPRMAPPGKKSSAKKAGKRQSKTGPEVSARKTAGKPNARRR